MSKPEKIILKYEDWEDDQKELTRLRKNLSDLADRLESERRTNKAIDELHQKTVERLERNSRTSLLRYFRSLFQFGNTRKYYIDANIILRLLETGQKAGVDTEWTNMGDYTLIKDKC